jgi:inner membrane protein
LDSLTQIVLGASVGEAVLGKKIGNKALLYGAIAGTIPDLDVLTNYFTDTITAIELHRGFSHSILFCILLSPLLGWTVAKLERKIDVGWRAWTLLFFLGLFTHTLLDAFTTWGTQLFWPFDLRVAFNSIFVIDPLYTLPFLICVLIVLFNKRGSKSRSRFNTLGIVLSSAYLLVAVAFKYITYLQIKASLDRQQIEYREISTRPAPMNILLWNVNIDTDDHYLIGDYSVFDSSEITFSTYPKNRQASLALVEKPNVQRLIAISQGWYLLSNKQDRWYFNDLRFGQMPTKSGEQQFVFSYALDEVGGKFYATEVPKTTADARFILNSLWERIKGK